MIWFYVRHVKREEGNKLRHIVFLIAYIYFVYNDFKRRQIKTVAMAAYAIAALITVTLTKDAITMNRFVDILFSIGFGLIIYMLSYFSGEGIGIADGMYFVINGFLLTLKENLILFFTGIMVAFIIGIIMFIVCKKRNRGEMQLPFMPCFLPAIIGYIICIV